jgi:heme exporter protein A
MRASKVYGAVRALRTVSCAFEWGTVTVVQGGNGSGKSTLLALVAGRGRPTSGAVVYGDGLGGEHGLERGVVGWAGHESLCYGDLTGRENIELGARLYGLDVGEAYREAAARFDLGSFAERALRTYSRGQRQRISIARSLLHRPKLVVMDEPTAGLDAGSCGVLVLAVREEARRGAVVVVATHDDGFAQAIADGRIRLDGGRLVTGGAGCG